MKGRSPQQDSTPRLEDLPDLITRRELAALAGIAEQTLARWAVAGEVNRGPRITRLGRAVRYQKQHVREWLDSRAEPAAEHSALAG